ncbi:DUF6884 domain-containing protein [Brochothrix campestris]|uniref:DUF6884 domain-containing protein n=1 Tax=Brochothrix campestris FSL F6-1037 TaxID=1265861 RepID=W7CQL9_9LIST|nr:DUF6884 domain-containing protein [Brochothrix campestris]EUJ41924.1 hypothetical protein BCAMP_01720 [Brochothrix campestris FSL F6-1037]
MTVIIASGKPKRWDKLIAVCPLPAGEVYTGTFHRLCRQYVEQFLPKEQVLILSPFYGLVALEQMLDESYDVRFNASGLNSTTITATRLRAQWQQHYSDESPLYLFGGQKFIKVVAAFMTATDAQRVQYPLHGLGGIGKMQQRMKQAILLSEPFHR